MKLHPKYMQELSQLATQLNRNIERLNQEIFSQTLRMNITSESSNTMWKERYEEYLKSGGIDDYPTWIVKTDSKNLFP